MTNPTDTEQPEQLLTTAEVARELRVSTVTVRRWMDDGTLPGFTRGRTRRISRASFDQFLAESTRTSKALTVGGQR
jgi:excisionase family DNA binding protein